MMDRDEQFREAVKKTIKENKELLDRLDDRDEDGTPYWEHQIHD